MKKTSLISLGCHDKLLFLNRDISLSWWQVLQSPGEDWYACMRAAILLVHMNSLKLLKY